MTGPDLKPCPFCGGNAEYRVTHDEGQRNDYDTIECLSCRAEMSVLLHWAESEGANRNTLTTAWNTRDPAVLAALPEVQALIAAAHEDAAQLIRSIPVYHFDREYASEHCARAIARRTPDDATAALAARDAAMIARGMREAAEVAFGVTPYKRVRGEAGYSDLMCARSDGTWQSRKETQAAILTRAAGIEKDAK